MLKNFCGCGKKKGNTKQETIAKALGISQPVYSDYEQGKRTFSEDFIKKICEFFSIEPTDFLAPSNGLVMGNQSTYASQNISNNDIKLIETLKEVFSIALKAKDQTIETQQKMLDMLSNK